jgi:hypothetical protein
MKKENIEAINSKNRSNLIEFVHNISWVEAYVGT